MTTGEPEQEHQERAPGRPTSSRLRDAHVSALQRALPIYYALLLAALTVFGLYLLLQLRHVVLILFISLIFAAATARPAAQLQNLRVPAALSVALIYLASLGIIAVVAWYVLPPLVNQIAVLIDQIPNYVDRYEKLRITYNALRDEYPSLGPLEDQVTSVASGVVTHIGRWLAALPTRLFGIFLDVLSVFVISILLVTSRQAMLRTILALVHPNHREQTRFVLIRMWEQVGHYIRAKIIEMAIIGTITYIVLLLLGIPFPLLLATVVALGEAIPRVGPWLARIPLLAIAALEGWTIFGLTAVASVVIENLKGFVISPLVEGNQLNIHPLLVFVAVLVGSSLLGVAGAFVAVPAAAMIQVLFEEVIIPWRKEQLNSVAMEAAREREADLPPESS